MQNPPTADNPFDVLGSILGLVSSTLAALMSIVSSIHMDTAVTHLLSWINAGMAAMSGDRSGVATKLNDPNFIIGQADETVGAPIVEGLLRYGLGINPDYAPGPLSTANGKANWQPSANISNIHSDSRQGVATLKRIVGFGIFLSVAFTALQSVLKMIGAQRISDAIGGTLGKLPEVIGMNFAIGMAMSSMFETAAGKQLEELVNVQLHPNRLDMQTVRALARQHKITQDQYWAALDLLGFPDDLKSFMLLLDSQQLGLSDLQSLYVTGTLSRDAISTYLEQVGFSDTDVTLLLDVYIDKAETQGMTMYRNMVRTAFAERRITSDQFADMLAQLLLSPQTAPAVPASGKPHYDAASPEVQSVIDLEVGAQEFAHSFGRAQQSISTIEKQYATQHITVDEAIKALQSHGYSDTDARALIAVWSYGPHAGKPALTTAKILQYEKSGVFSQAAALQKLLNLGVSADDATFLSANPDAKAGPYYPPFSVDTITQAYYDDAATDQEVVSALEQLGYSNQAAQEELKIAYDRKTHKLLLPVSDVAGFQQTIRSLYMGGGLKDAETIDLLERTGMLQSDAGMTWAGWYTERFGHAPGPPAG